MVQAPDNKADIAGPIVQAPSDHHSDVDSRGGNGYNPNNHIPGAG